MSYSITYEVPPCPTCGHDASRPHGWNPTYNYRSMFEAAFGGHGIREFDGMTGAQAHPRLAAGIADMRARPDHFRKFDSGNGWGMYNELILGVLEEIRDMCARYPYGVLKIS